MYVYFDKKGALREIINDEALRQGNYGVNKIYVYYDNGIDGKTSKNYSSIDVAYVLSSGASVSTQNYSTFEETMIPFDQKRDLRFFRYGQTYRFCVVNMEPEPGDDDNTFGDSPLQENGVVHCSMTANLTAGGQEQLGDINFEVEGAAALELGTVGPEHYLSLANYQYLRELVDNCVPYTGASKDINIGEHSLSAGQVKISNSNSHEECLEIGSGNRKIEIHSDFIGQTLSGSEHYYYFGGMDGIIATQEWVGNQNYATQSQLPSQGLCATFSTGDFHRDDNVGNYFLNNIPLSNFIAGSNMLIITWGNCYALCPIPTDGNPGRVVAAMWDANGEAKTIRVRYQLKSNNTLLDISLQSGFVPPDDYTASVQCIKLFS